MDGLAFRVRVALLLLRLWLWWGWRRKVAGLRFPVEVEPDRRRDLPPVDTGGAYRAPFGSQFSDPSESHTSPHSEGSNCTMAAAGMALDYHTGGRVRKRGGDMRHHQSDNDSGTDLYDAAEAWAHYGESLSIRSGQGWSKVVAALDDGRGVILQGTGGVAGCGNYTGGHAIYVAPEKHSDGRWLKGDPECSGYEWTSASNLKAFAERLSSGVYFAVTKATTAPPPPEPECPDCPPPVPYDPRPAYDNAFELGGQMADDAAVGAWVQFLGQPKGGTWNGVAWGPVEPVDLDDLDDCGGGVGGGVWGRGVLPDPVAAAVAAKTTPPAFDGSAWSRTLFG
jgi:hypothetical protein